MATIEETRDILSDMPLTAIGFDGRCHLKNYSNGNFRAGHIEIVDLMENQWRIVDGKTGSIDEFETLEGLLDAGWVLD